MKKYTIEAWSNWHESWVPILGTPTQFSSAEAAKDRLRMCAKCYWCRLKNSKGKVVQYAGLARVETFIPAGTI